jgi:hypothetical protein
MNDNKNMDNTIAGLMNANKLHQQSRPGLPMTEVDLPEFLILYSG